MLRALVSGLALLALSGCGPPPEDIAAALRNATERFRDPEAATESICRALERYSSTPASKFSELLEAIERQRGYAGEPGASDLADAASDVNDTQQAAEVAANLGC